ncbi:MAG: hypothetical protein ABI123_09070 [Ginsengibacter sp.]
MKKIMPMLIAALALFSTTTFAQIEKGNVMVGGDLANMNLILGGGGAFSLQLNPKAAFFIQDNLALGGYVNLGLATAKGAGTTTNYGVGGLARYYVNKPRVNVLKHGRLFFEGNVGIQGINTPGGGGVQKKNTNGLGFGIGPGYAYFITPNIGLETLLKYDGTRGFGNQPYRSDLNLNIGFQIYLPQGKARAIVSGTDEK